jgi:hypothetical protein
MLHLLPSARRAAAILVCISALTAFLASDRLAAQTPGIDHIAGTTFVVAFPDTTRNTADARYPDTRFVDKQQLLIYSAVDNTVRISSPALSRTISVAAGTFAVVDVNDMSPVVTEHCAVRSNTIRITAESPIVVHQYIATKFGAEAWTPLPVEAWGTEHYAAMHPGEIGANVAPGGEFDYWPSNTMFPAEILVVAAYDDTRITIVPNGRVLNECTATDVLLQAGEAYSIQSFVDTLTANVGGPQPDLGGSRILSTKPVGVISGNTRAQLLDDNVGLAKNSFKNMLVEWVPPTSLHGTQFVYMPTWDSHRPTGAPGEHADEKRKAEFVRIYATAPGETRGSYMEGGVSFAYPRPLLQSQVRETGHTPNLARVHVTDRPAQAMMASAAVVAYAGTTVGFGGYIGAAYDAWGGYMVELTPRERWPSFAPFIAPSHPEGMVHYIDVVTDSAHSTDVYLRNGTNFIFQRSIAGTDLVWGSMAVTPGVANWLEGRDGARFYAYVYGTLASGGHEEYRPGATRLRRDPPNAAHARAGDDPRPLHPSEYEERLAIAYAYPLAATIDIAAAHDSLRIEQTEECRRLTVSITALNPSPIGLRSIWLEGAINTRIESLTPTVLQGASQAVVVVSPIDMSRDAEATIVITDRSGWVTRVAYSSAAERLSIAPPRLDFGELPAQQTVTREIVIVNPLDRPQTIRAMRLRLGGGIFRIVEPATLPVTIAPHDSIRVIVDATAPSENTRYDDTLELSLDCTLYTVALSSSSDEPCVWVDDLDFGTLAPGQSATKPLRICNNGGGTVSFSDSTGFGVLTWLSTSFSVSAADLARLRGVVLGRGECVTVSVTFNAGAAGTYRDKARVWTSTRSCRDTSLWNARVVEPVSAPAEPESISSLDVAAPNPFTSATTIRFTLARAARATIVLYDDRGARVTTLVDRDLPAGVHATTFDGAGLPAGVYHCRLSAGTTAIVRTLIKR